MSAQFRLSFPFVRADEAIFAGTYTTDLLPKAVGIPTMDFRRWEKEHGIYSVVDFREELEYGVTDNLQIALCLNRHYI